MLKTLLALCLALSTAAGAQSPDNDINARTGISVFAGFSSGKYFFKSRSNGVVTTGRSNGFGCVLHRDWYVFLSQLYVSLALSYFTTSSGVKVLTNLDGFDQRSNVSFQARYDHFTVPVHIGKTVFFSKSKDAFLNIYSGFSLGVSYIGGVQQQVSTFEDYGRGDLLSCSAGYYLPNEHLLYSSFDLGLTVKPFGTENFTVGLAAAFDMDHPNDLAGKGSFMNDTKKLQQDFTFNYSKQLTTLRVSAGYIFSSRKKHRKQTKCY